MRARSTSVERTPPSGFHPRFCPLPDCEDHHLPPSRRYRYVRNGFYQRRCDRKRVQRFRCKRCHSGFSQQTFSVTYCMKRPDLLPVVAHWIPSGAPLRRITRSHNGLQPRRPCHPATVTRLSRRIGSQCLLLQDELHRELPPIREPVVSDHFGTFEVTPVNFAVGRGRQLPALDCDGVTHQRRCSVAQRRNEARRSPGAAPAFGIAKRTLASKRALRGRRSMIASQTVASGSGSLATRRFTR